MQNGHRTRGHDIAEKEQSNRSGHSSTSRSVARKNQGDHNAARKINELPPEHHSSEYNFPKPSPLVVPGQGSTDNAADLKDASPKPPAEASQDGLLLKKAVERAKAGGRPLTITQIGDSHIAFGSETPSIAENLAKDLGLKPDQIKFSSVGDVGKTASYAKDHPGEFMKNVNGNADLVIVSFGSNEATSNEGAQYKKDYGALIGQIQSRDPRAAIAMVGPTDGNFWGSSKHLPGLESVTAAQAAVAGETPKSTYLKVASEMGSVATMRSDGSMGTDNLHLTPAGYKKLGGIIADRIARATE